MVGRPRMRLRNLIVGALLCVSLLVAAPAYAQTASQDGYSSPRDSVQEQITTRHDPIRHSTSTESRTTTRASNNGGNLPFTGLDVMLIVAAGGVLLAMGVGIRRLSRAEVA